MNLFTKLIAILALANLIGCALFEPPTVRCLPELEKLYNPKKLPDLRPRTVKITVNHTQKTCCVAAVIQNNGDVDINGPFIVAIGITVVQPDGLRISSEKSVEIPTTVTIPKLGGEYTTEECSQSKLFYCDELGSLPNNAGTRAYWIEVIVDVEHKVDEINETNNYFETFWCTNQ